MFTIEHPGTKESTVIANNIFNLIESDFGQDGEVVVGRYEDDTTVYYKDENNKDHIVGTFNSSPNSETLKFFIDLYI